MTDIIITLGHLGAIITDRGTLTRATADALRIPWPVRSGWQERLIGRKVSLQTWNKAVAGKSALSRQAKRRREQENANG
jgi:hypothetical protein